MADDHYQLVMRVQKLIEVDRHSDAIPYIVKALATDPEDHYLNACMALCLYEIRRLEEALRFADKAVEYEPDDEWGHRLRSLILSGMGRKRESLAAAEEAVRLDPDNVWSLNTLAGAYLAIKRPKKAKEIAEKLVELDPADPTTHFTLGNTHLALNDNWLAERSFREVLHLDPNFTDARNNLGVAMLRQKNNEPGSFFGLQSPSIIQPASESIDQHFEDALRQQPDNETAAANFRMQHSYGAAIAPVFAFIPFMLMAFYVIPVGALISFGITLFWSLKAVKDVRDKRMELSPELLTFVKSTSFWTDEGVLGMFSGTMWQAFLKTWRPHVLALAAVILQTWFIANKLPNYRIIAFIMMVAAFWWMVFDSRKPDLDGT